MVNPHPAGHEVGPARLSELDLAADFARRPCVVVVAERDERRIARDHAGVPCPGESVSPGVGQHPEPPPAGRLGRNLAGGALIEDHQAFDVAWVGLAQDGADRAPQQLGAVPGRHDNGHGRPRPAGQARRAVAHDGRPGGLPGAGSAV